MYFYSFIYGLFRVKRDAAGRDSNRTEVGTVTALAKVLGRRIMERLQTKLELEVSDFKHRCHKHVTQGHTLGYTD